MKRNFKDIFTELKNSSGKTGKELAKIFKVSESMVTNWTKGANRPRLDTLEEIADFFGTTTDFLLGRDAEIKLDVTDLTEEQILLLNSLIEMLRSNNNG